MKTHPEEFTDTDPRAMEVWLDMLRRMSPGERIAAALNLTDFALKMSETGVRSAFPDADDREVLLRTAARRFSRDLMVRAYGWDPEVDGHSG